MENFSGTEKEGLGMMFDRSGGERELRKRILDLFTHHAKTPDTYTCNH